MGIVDEDIERLRSTVSIVDTVQQYVALKRVGRNWVGLCPFHAEKSGSFNVREETGRYKCFGCDKGGDVFTFIQEIEHLDFPGAVEHLAAKAGIQLNYTTTGQSKERARRKQLVEAMDEAVEWYHQRLLNDPDARAARDYLRRRGLAGDIARQFKLGWAPDDWDALARGLGASPDVLQAVGLAFRNKRNKMQDSFRARVMFPIFSESGEALAFGGRILPGSDDPAKYTIAFAADGRLSARIDCNRGAGNWKVTGSNQLELGPLALTRAMCPAGSLHDHIVKQWSSIRSFLMKDGHLFLVLMADGGTFEFEPRAAAQ